MLKNADISKEIFDLLTRFGGVNDAVLNISYPDSVDIPYANRYASISHYEGKWEAALPSLLHDQDWSVLISCFLLDRLADPFAFLEAVRTRYNVGQRVVLILKAPGTEGDANLLEEDFRQIFSWTPQTLHNFLVCAGFEVELCSLRSRNSLNLYTILRKRPLQSKNTIGSYIVAVARKVLPSG